MTTVFGILLRCAVAYVYLLVVIRLAGKRTIAQGTPFDFVVALIISDFPDDMVWGEVPLAQGIVAIGTVALLHMIVTVGVAYSQQLDRLITSAPTLLIRSGKTINRNLAFERLNNMELDEMLREAKIDSHNQVQEAHLEPSGILTVRRTADTEFARKRDLSK